MDSDFCIDRHRTGGDIGGVAGDQIDLPLEFAERRLRPTESQFDVEGQPAKVLFGPGVSLG